MVGFPDQGFPCVDFRVVPAAPLTSPGILTWLRSMEGGQTRPRLGARAQLGPILL